MIWNISVKYKIPIIYASSAATYGLGEYGFLDDHKIVNSLKPQPIWSFKIILINGF